MKRHITITIYGIVQGVSFRSYIFSQARTLHICGFVQNESDGSVYIEAEGEADNIDQFTSLAKLGPDKAVVEHVAMQEGELQGYEDFKIRY